MIDPDDGQPWDCSKKEKREKARRMQREQRPILLIGSPMCTYFSMWQYLNFSKSQDRAAMHRAYVGACAHMRFVAEMYHEQIESNRYFLHEHHDTRHRGSSTAWCSWKASQALGLSEATNVSTEPLRGLDASRICP